MRSWSVADGEGLAVGSGRCEGFARGVGDDGWLELGTAAGGVTEGVGSRVAGIAVGVGSVLGIGSSVTAGTCRFAAVGFGLVVGLGSAATMTGVLTAMVLGCGVARLVVGMLEAGPAVGVGSDRWSSWRTAPTTWLTTSLGGLCGGTKVSPSRTRPPLITVRASRTRRGRCGGSGRKRSLSTRSAQRAISVRICSHSTVTGGVGGTPSSSALGSDKATVHYPQRDLCCTHPCRRSGWAIYVCSVTMPTLCSLPDPPVPRPEPPAR